MTLVEQHQITKKHPSFHLIDDFTFKSKNLFNATLYHIRQHFFKENKYLSYPELNKQFTKEQNIDYISLPRKVSQQTMKIVDSSFKSFFALLNSKKVKKDKVQIPKYLEKDGRFIVHFTKQAISTKSKKDFIKLSGLDFYIKSNKVNEENIQGARLVPKSYGYIIELLYNQPIKDKIKTNKYSAIDLGVNNLASVAVENGNPFIINGKPLKSINQYYNKKRAHYKSRLKKDKDSKRLISLTRKRNNKIKDYMHKASTYLANQLVSHSVSNLVIGHNTQWKQDANLGKKNNQNFISIPHTTFINLLKYKCELRGIEVETVNEAYTSKCSYIDKEMPHKREEYLGERVYRGLFKSADGTVINADINASYNILNVARKGITDFVEVYSTPVIITITK